MISIGSSDDVTPIEPARSDDAAGPDDELERLRARERELQVAYVRDPWNIETQRSLVRVQQSIRRIEENAQRLADNGPSAPPLDAAEYARHGAPIRWVESPPTAAQTLDLTTPVARFNDPEIVKKQIALTEAAMAFGHPELYFRLGDLRQRLSEIQAHTAPRQAPPIPAQPPTTPLGHGSCAPPRPIAMPGNAARVADAGVDLETSLRDGSHLTTPELERYIDAYIAYTATKPELRALHDRAVTRGPELLADRLEADDEARERAAMHARVDIQTTMMHVRPPIGVQQHVIVGGIAIKIAEAARLVISFAPGHVEIIDAALSLVEAATGRGLGGLGPPTDSGAVERAFEILFALAPYADKLLSAGAAGAAGIVRLARATGRTEAEMRATLVAARDVGRDRAAIQQGLALARAGRAVSPRSAQAMYRARQRVTQLGAVMLGGPSAGVVRAQRARNAQHVQQHIGTVASPSSPPPGYIVYAEGNGRVRIRRVVPDDELSAPLTVDSKGTIQWGSADRLSKPGALANALGPAPPNHQAHHLVPDAVARDSALLQEARRRGSPPFNIDGGGNGVYAPSAASARTATTASYPLHSGSHPIYSRAAADVARREEERLLATYGSLEKVPPSELTKATRRVEDEMRKKFQVWTATHGDRLQ